MGIITGNYSIPEGILNHLRDEALIEAKKRWHESEGALSKTVVPLYHAGEKGALLHSGSSLILQISDRYFLVTAAHVLEPIKGSEMYLNMKKGVGSELSKLTGNVTLTLAKDEDHSDDNIDIGFVELSKEKVDAVVDSDFRVINISEIELDHITDEKKYYTFTGYPTNRVTLEKYTKIVRPEALTYTCGPVDSIKILLLEKGLLRKQDNLAVQLGKAKSSKTNAEVRTPKLSGVSGGGLWRVQDFTSWHSGSERPLLIGIITEQDKKQHDVVKTTRISRVINIILNVYPELLSMFPGMTRINEVDLLYYKAH